MAVTPAQKDHNMNRQYEPVEHLRHRKHAPPATAPRIETIEHLRQGLLNPHLCAVAHLIADYQMTKFPERDAATEHSRSPMQRNKKMSSTTEILDVSSALSPEYTQLAEPRRFEAADEQLKNRLRKRMRERFSIDHDLQMSGSGRPSVAQVLGFSGPDSARAKAAGLPSHIPFQDHTSLWNYRGKPAVWIFQPYSWESVGVSEIASECGLQLCIARNLGWQFPPSTDLVALVNPNRFRFAV